MFLTQEDVERIKGIGYSLDFFVRNVDGWLQLRNHQGQCVFHDGHHCTIYEFRPEGCTLYPLVYLKDDNSVILDNDCPQRSMFPRSDYLIKKLEALVSRLEQERIKRLKNMD